MHRRTLIAAAALAVAAAAPAAAGAHVTVQPNEVPAGQFVRVDVRVPNERDDAGTRKVQVRFPPGFASASFEPVPGWDVRVTRRKAREADRAARRVGDGRGRHRDVDRPR